MDLVSEALGAQLPKAAVDFFIVFSRCECALKRSKTYAKGDENGVDPDWDRLAKDLGQPFLNDVIKLEIAPVLIAKPPKKQVLRDGELGWKDIDAVKNPIDLFHAIRRARNNLVHGAKYNDAGHGEPALVEGSERDNTLLVQSLAVLEHALKLHPVLFAFYQR